MDSPPNLAFLSYFLYSSSTTFSIGMYSPQDFRSFPFLIESTIAPDKQNLGKPPPWEEKDVLTHIINLEKKKCLYDNRELKEEVENKVPSLFDRGVTQVYCDGAVLENGRAGCGILILYKNGSPVSEKEISLRISDNVCSTQAELCAILYGLKEIKSVEGNVHFYIDSRSAIESLTSRHPVCEEVTLKCKTIIHEMRKQNRNVLFTWIPSHIGITHNERADKLAKLGAEQDTVMHPCDPTMKQIKTLIRKRQNKEAKNRMEKKYTNSETFQHYIKVAQLTDFTYGRLRSAWKDSLCTRLRLGYKYLWQIGVVRTNNEHQCRLCKEPGSHTLHHYALHCQSLESFRNRAITNVTDQIIWMLNNDKVDEMSRQCKDVRAIIYQ